MDLENVVNIEEIRKNICLQPIHSVNEAEISKKLVKFVHVLRSHVSLWTETTKSLTAPLRTMLFLCDQLRKVESARIKDLDVFDCIQTEIITNIIEKIEVELIAIQTDYEKLQRSYHALASALFSFEKSTENIDFGSKSSTVNGNDTQPPLTAILQHGLCVLALYSGATENIPKLKTVKFRDERKLKELASALTVDPADDKCVYELLYLTQYVDSDTSMV